MELEEKLEILSDAAKYDVSCSSSGSSNRGGKNSLGNTKASGICHSWSDDGRCISLLKILFSNYCIYDCQYCANRSSVDRKRATFTPEEVAKLTIDFYKRNYIEGLFLSSAVTKSPDWTMEQLLETARLLRNKYNYQGYLHLKAIPGADFKLIYQAGLLTDRMSVNIELPSEKSLKKLAPQKEKAAILKPMQNIGTEIENNLVERKKYKKQKEKFVPAGHSTQLIVGASPESDRTIINLAEGLYNKFNLKRVYYSAYLPVSNSSLLPALNSSPPLKREHRLYQADWLLRFYGFKADELLNLARENLDLKLDPKADWALNNLDKFPVEVNTADYQMLLRVPGIGPRSAAKIVKARKEKKLNHYNLKKMRIVLKRANFFITCDGKYAAAVPFDSEIIYQRLVEKEAKQLSLFSNQGNK
ncbi:putative DNA modification/repair radical SAM protein [Halanaerobium hydrogeniformans]|uniref:Radical SAM domain protein n=1 Tax=Halanaerobium hydrogeniformans TaxID=656519 RepID=E4RN25_HALHG|nr:putative DNA modification/repair radical SAM protein [Halanaerobium hydrogeniformans]ADQ14242.1 radical SAM domain protein [Halanaerobium hydrogeniformans]